jgi:hypothetical protein
VSTSNDEAEKGVHAKVAASDTADTVVTANCQWMGVTLADEKRRKQAIDAHFLEQTKTGHRPHFCDKAQVPQELIADCGEAGIVAGIVLGRLNAWAYFWPGPQSTVRPS